MINVPIMVRDPSVFYFFFFRGLPSCHNAMDPSTARTDGRHAGPLLSTGYVGRNECEPIS